jgi:hypothetical protein
MKGIKYYNFLGFYISYGWHNLHSGKGYKTGCGTDISFKALTVYKIPFKTFNGGSGINIVVEWKYSI